MNRRVWLQYSTRIVLLVVVAAALPFAWLRRRLNQTTLQATAVDRLQALGGIVCYHHAWDYERDCFSNAPMPGTAFLRSILGDHFFLRVDGIVFVQFAGDATQLTALYDLPMITDVNIVDAPNINDDIFPILTQLPKLKTLSLAGTAVTAQGVTRLESLCDLRSLIISETSVQVDELALVRRHLPRCHVDHDHEQEIKLKQLLIQLATHKK